MILGMHDFCTGPNPPGTYMIIRPCMSFVNQSPYTIIEKYFLWSKKVGRPKAKCLLTSRKISSCDITLFLQSQRNFPFSPTIVFNKYLFNKYTNIYLHKNHFFLPHDYLGPTRLFFWKIFPPCTLIWACTLNFSLLFCPPARLLGTTRLLGTPE